MYFSAMKSGFVILSTDYSTDLSPVASSAQHLIYISGAITGFWKEGRGGFFNPNPNNQSIVGVRIEKPSLSVDKLGFSLINPDYQQFTHLACHTHILDSPLPFHIELEFPQR